MYEEIAENALIESFNRTACEGDILAIANIPGIQSIFQTYTREDHGIKHFTMTVTRDRSQVKYQLQRGLSAILRASCDRRIQTLHWMIMRLKSESSYEELVECLFTEAKMQKDEAEGDEIAIIEAVFGV